MVSKIEYLCMSLFFCRGHDEATWEWRIERFWAVQGKMQTERRYAWQNRLWRAGSGVLIYSACILAEENGGISVSMPTATNGKTLSRSGYSSEEEIPVTRPSKQKPAREQSPVNNDGKSTRDSSPEILAVRIWFLKLWHPFKHFNLPKTIWYSTQTREK